MGRPPLPFSFGTVIACLTLAATAHTQPATHMARVPDRSEQSIAVPKHDLSLVAPLGVMSYRERQGGVLVGFNALYRYGWLTVGANAEGGGFVMHANSLGGLAGLVWRGGLGIRFELLGSMGVHWYERWGSGLLDQDPGGAATLPYAGGVSRLSYVFGRSPGRHLLLGVQAGIDRDWWRVRRHYSHQETGWLTGDTYTAEADHIVGGTRYTASLLLGGTLDLGS